MVKTLARDLLRVAVFIPFVSSRIEKVIDRAWWWADDVFVVTPDSRTLDAETYPIGNVREPFDTFIADTAWREFERRLELKERDYVVVLYPDEVLVNADAIRPAIRLHMGKAIGFKRYFMVDEHHYSTHFTPELVWPVIPYKNHSSFVLFDNQLRGPNYVPDLSKIAISATDILDYTFSDIESRSYWASFYNISRMKNLHKMSKVEWERGGKL